MGETIELGKSNLIKMSASKYTESNDYLGQSIDFNDNTGSMSGFSEEDNINCYENIDSIIKSIMRTETKKQKPYDIKNLQKIGIKVYSKKSK